LDRRLCRYSRCALLLLAASLFVAPRAAGEQVTAGVPASFRWSFVRLPGAESCPGAEGIAAGVRSRLGRDPFANDADRNIEGMVTREGEVWRAHLSVIGPDGAVLGSRDLQSSEPDCSTLAAAVTLAVALVIDPRAAFAPASAPPPPAEPVPAPAPSPLAPLAPPAMVAAPPLTRPPASLTVRRPAEPVFAVSLRAAVALGLLPRAAFGVESGGELGLSAHWGLSGGVSYFPEVRTADAGFAFGLSAGFLGACVHAIQTQAARLAICGEVQLGAMHAVVYSVRPLPPGDHVWAGARVGPRVRLKLSHRVWVEAGAQGLAPLIRHEFVLKDQQNPVFQSSPLTFAATLGLSASIP
jgi:hypothetical protein